MRAWTENEFEYLHDNLGIKSYSEIAQYLKRTKKSVLLKAQRCNISVYDNIYAFLSLSKDLGVSVFVLRKWYLQGYLPGRQATWSRKRGHTVDYPIIFTEDNVLYLLRKHPGIVVAVLGDTLIPNRYFRNSLHNHSVVPYNRTGALHKDSQLQMAGVSRACL